LKSGVAWREYSRSGKKPADIPANPNAVYAGWAGMGDWLDTGRVARGQYRSFKKARAYVRGLGLKSFTQWRVYCKSGKKPADIAANPQKTYAEDGWSGWGDWLGYARNTQARERSRTVPRTQGTKRFSPADQSYNL
jgi:hypothetical protein